VLPERLQQARAPVRGITTTCFLGEGPHNNEMKLTSNASPGGRRLQLISVFYGRPAPF
jgi:hypothetical protein